MYIVQLGYTRFLPFAICIAFGDFPVLLTSAESSPPTCSSSSGMSSSESPSMSYNNRNAKQSTKRVKSVVLNKGGAAAVECGRVKRSSAG